MEIAQTCENCDSRVYKSRNHIYCEKRKIMIWRGFYDKSCYTPTTNSHILGFYKKLMDELPSTTNCEGAMHDWLKKNGLLINREIK